MGQTGALSLLHERARVSPWGSLALLSTRVADPAKPRDRLPKDSGYLRAAVVQLHFHPAFTPKAGTPSIEHPLGQGELLLQNLPSPTRHRALRELRQRVAREYLEQLRAKTIAVLRWCKDWNVDVVVFPEYSLPATLLPDVAREGERLVIVAGSHLVDQEAFRERVYQSLGSTEAPELGTAVSPVFVNGQLAATVPKLHASPIGGEADFLNPGKNWRPVQLPEGLCGPMGVLLCIDFIDDRHSAVQDAPGPQQTPVRFWAVPSFTPSTRDFHQEAGRQARRYKRPTLYANNAEWGGSGVFADTTGQPDNGLAALLARDGGVLLAEGEEGLLVADVDLGQVPTGKATAYAARAPVRVIAAPSLVYQTDAQYRGWLARLSNVLQRGDEAYETLENARAKCGEVLDVLEDGSLPPTRRARLDRYASVAESITDVATLVSLTAEVLLPPDVLPHHVLETALAEGALAVLRSWREAHASWAELEALDRRLFHAVFPLGPALSAKSEAKRQVAGIAKRIRGDAPALDDPGRLAETLQIYATELEGRWRADYDEARGLLNNEQFEAGRTRIEELFRSIQVVLARIPQDEAALAWLARAHLLQAVLLLNAQDPDGAQEALSHVVADRVGPNESLTLARVYAELGDIREAETWLGRAGQGAGRGLDQGKLAVTRQIVVLKAGEVPDPLLEEPSVLLRAAELYLERKQLARGVDCARRALASSGQSPMRMASAFILLVRAIHWSVFELAGDVRPLDAAQLKGAIELAERCLEQLEEPRGGLRTGSFPDVVVSSLEHSRSVYYFAIFEPDYAERRIRDSRWQDPAIREAVEKARQGELDAALTMLPRLNHPWLNELRQADFLTIAREHARALDLLRTLSRDYPDRGPIELSGAEKELHSGNLTEALSHAEAAHALVAARGYRWVLAQCLCENGHLERAWGLLGEERPRAGARVLFTLATLASRIHPDEAPGLWEKYLEVRPEDINARLRWAEALNALGETGRAADVGWATFERFEQHLTAQGLFQCASLQVGHRVQGIRATDRIRRIAQVLHWRFRGDPGAEMLKLRLSLLLGEDAELPPADVDVLEAHGFAFRVDTEHLTQETRALRRPPDWQWKLYQQGAIPLAVVARLLGQTPAELIAVMLEPASPLDDSQGPRWLDPRRRFCAPLEPWEPLNGLDGAELLASDVELLAVARLGLIQDLADSLRGGTARLLVPLEYRERLLMQGRPLQSRAGPELVEQALELVNTGVREGWVRHPTWQEGCEEQSPPDAPALRETASTGAELWRAIAEQPLREALNLAALIHARPNRWRLTVDYHATGSAGHLGFLRLLRWEGSDHVHLNRYLRAANRRCLTLPQLVRLLCARAESRCQDLLSRLARSGFPDALNRIELIDHVRSSQPGGMPSQELEGLEHLAQALAGIEGYWAGFHLQDKYAGAMVDAFLGSDADVRSPEDSEPLPVALPAVLTAQRPSRTGSVRAPLPPAEAQWLTTGLLERLEALDRHGGTFLQGTLRSALLYALRDPREALDSPDCAGLRHLSADTPVGRLLTTIHAWAGPNGSRRGAWGRALRTAWCLLDETAGADGPTDYQALPLFLGQTSTVSSGSLMDPEGEAVLSTALTSPEDEALAILSANWKQRHLARQFLTLQRTDGEESRLDLEAILQSAADMLGGGDEATARAVFDERLFQATLPLPTAPEAFPILLPVEAVLLRVPSGAAVPAFARLRDLQGAHDGRSYELLARLEKTPDDPELRRIYARHTTFALWRLVRDDPSFLMRWPQTLSTGSEGGLPRLDDLLSVLHEPSRPLGSTVSIGELLTSRSGWNDLSGRVRSSLYGQILQLPGGVSLEGMARGLYDAALPENVEAALRHAEEPQTVPAGSLAQGIMVLRVAMQKTPVISLSRGVIDLRDAGPRAIADVVCSVSSEPGAVESIARDEAESPRSPVPGSPQLSVGTMAQAETALLRACGAVCERLLQGQPAREADWLWLTYRLHAWLCAQLRVLSSSEREEGIRALAELAPRPMATPPAGPADLFNPFFFEARRFNYRLSLVLYALAAADEWTEMQAAEHRQAPAPVSSPRLERQLLELAAAAAPDCEQADSWFEWPLPANTADLALGVLLQLNPERIRDLPEESLIARIRRWPGELVASPERQQVFITDVVRAMSLHIDEVRLQVRLELEAKLVSWTRHGRESTLRWIGLTSLFRVGRDSLREVVEPLLAEHLQDADAVQVIGWYLEGVARTGASLDQAVMRLARRHNVSGVVEALAQAVARVAIHGESPAQEAGRALLAKLAEDPEFGNNSTVRELARYLGARAPKDSE